MRMIRYAAAPMLWMAVCLSSTASAAPTCQMGTSLADYDKNMVPLLRDAYSNVADSSERTTLIHVRSAFRVEVRRPSRVFSAQIAIRIEQISEGRRQPICYVESHRLGANNGIVYFVVAGITELSLFEVTLVDYGEGGPTGDAPYTLQLEVFEFREKPAPSKILKPLRPRAPDVCENVHGPKRVLARLESAGSAMSLSTSESLFIGYFRGGRNIYVQPGTIDGGAKFRVKLFSKNGGERLFESVCEFVVDGPLQGYLLSSVGDEYLFNRLWRIEIEKVNMEDSSSGDPITFSIYRDLDPEVENATDGIDETILVDSFACQTPSGRGTVVSDVSGDFGQRALFTASIIDETQLLSADARDRIRQLTLTALALWRRSCHACSPEHALFVEIDGALFTLEGALDRPAAWALIQGNSLSDINIRSGTRSSVQRYIPLDRNDELVRSICQYRPQLGSPDLQELKQTLGCDPERSNDLSAVLQIIISENGPRCGGGANTIACEEGQLLIQFNARDYSFHLPNSTKHLFGQGRRIDLFHVLLHEVGHWIGIDDVATQEHGDIMESTFETARCISDETRQTLKNIVAGEPTVTLMPLKAFSYKKP
jgi:hypothetical protein